MAEAKVTVRSDLLKIAEDLQAIARAAAETGDTLSATTKEVGKQVSDQTAVVSGALNKMRTLAKSIAGQIKDDFKTLFSVNAMLGGLKLNEQFSGSIKQAVQLNDTMRSLAPIFGMTQDKAERFKRALVSNLSDIGVGAEAAANALQGLSQTGVRGEGNLTAYSRAAGELAGVSKQKGQEGAIAKGLAGVVVAQGGNMNDPKAMQRVADDVLRIRNATGKSATEALDMLNKLFSSANTDFKKRLREGGGVGLAAAGLLGGEGSTSFLQRFMGMTAQGRAGMEAQGIGKLVGPRGEMNAGAFQDTIKEAMRRGGGNTEFGLQTMGMTEDEAKGFVRLSEAMRQNGEAIEKARTSVVDLNSEYHSTMGLGDAFRSNIDKVKGTVTKGMEALGVPDVINRGTQALAKAGESTAGSAAVVGGGAVLAAVLTSKGLGGLGKGLLGGELKSRAIEGITGEHVQKVEVINWPGGFGAGGIAGGAGGAGGMLGKAGLVGAAAVGSYAIGGAINDVIDKTTQGKTSEGFEGSAVERLIFKLDKMMGGESAQNIMKAQMAKDVRVTVESKDKSLKATHRGSRGTSQ